MNAPLKDRLDPAIDTRAFRNCCGRFATATHKTRVRKNEYSFCETSCIGVVVLIISIASHQDNHASRIIETTKHISCMLG